MQIVGMNYTINANGEKNFTIQGKTPYEPYYKNVEAGRNCIGERVESIYVGSYDCSNLKVGMEVEILYDKAIKTSKGMFQPIKRIDIISK